VARTRRELTEAYKQNPPPMGVFQIRHVPSGRILVASAGNLPGIMNSHRFQLRSGSHPNKRLQAEWNLHGADDFAFEVLDQLTPADGPGVDWRSELASLEDLWLEKLEPYGERGYHVKKQRPHPLGR
jgi:hypothetical protein